MQFNFVGLILVGLGIIFLGLGISGNYKSFGASLKAGVTKQSSASGSTAFHPPTNPHTLQA